jgi:hypothetical protein
VRTLTEIEAPADALPKEQKEQLLAFLLKISENVLELRNCILPVEVQGGLSFLFHLSQPRFG